jgi:hypothetical protein
MTSKTLLPVPKVLIPCALLLIAIAVKFIVTGDLDRAEIGAAVGTGLYAAIGYSTPPTYAGVKKVAKKVIPGTGRRKK